MSYLNPPYANNFQELCAAMPLFYLEVFEMRAILRAQGRLLDGVCGEVEKLVDVNFILTADEATIQMWEKALKIIYKSKLTLDQRKRVIIGYIIGLGHIGEKEIRDIIGQYTPNHVDFDFLRGTITILVEGEIFDEENLLETLLRRIPAHLGLKISIHIRKQYRQTIPFAQGGAVGSYFFFEPVTPGQAARMQYKFWQGSTSTSYMAGDTPQVHETAKKRVSVAQGAFDRPEITTDTPEIKTASTSREKATGGLFCHTHIKSKRID